VKVTLVVSTLNAGGMERAVVNMANAWVARGWRPTILTTSQRDRPVAFAVDPRVVHRDIGWRRDPADDEMDHASLNAIFGVLDLSDPPYDLMLADIVLLVMLRRAIQLTEPEAVVSFSDVMNIRMLIATTGLPFRRYVSERCDPERTSIGVLEPLRRRFYLHANGVAAQTDAAARHFERLGARCSVLPNMVLPPPPSPPRSERDGTRTLVSLGRLVGFKRLQIIVRAFAHIAEQHPRWRLDIWGEGNQRGFLEQLIEQLGAGDRIRLRGHAHDVHAVLRDADLFAMTSSTEGFPNALCEAMACGVVPVVVDCGSGVRTIVRDGIDGLLVPGEGPALFASFLDRLMRDDDERQRLAACAPEIVDRFSVDKVMDRWEELLAS